MNQHYSDPRRASDPHALPDLEVFEVTAVEAEQAVKRARFIESHDGEPEGEGYTEAGWYWWSCSPGCLPDSDPSGPFASEEEALRDARQGLELDDDDEDDEEERLEKFVSTHRDELDAAIRRAVPNIGSIDDFERQIWVANDEGLYRWFQSGGD